MFKYARPHASGKSVLRMRTKPPSLHIHQPILPSPLENSYESELGVQKRSTSQSVLRAGVGELITYAAQANGRTDREIQTLSNRLRVLAMQQGKMTKRLHEAEFHAKKHEEIELLKSQQKIDVSHPQTQYRRLESTV